MDCKYAVKSSKRHGWECSFFPGEPCMFLHPVLEQCLKDVPKKYDADLGTDDEEKEA